MTRLKLLIPILFAFSLLGCLTDDPRLVRVEDIVGTSDKQEVYEALPTRLGKLLGVVTKVTYKKIRSAWSQMLVDLRRVGLFFLIPGLGIMIIAATIHLAFKNPMLQGFVIFGLTLGFFSFLGGLICMLLANPWVLGTLLVAVGVGVGLLVYFLVNTRKVSVVDGGKTLISKVKGWRNGQSRT